MSETIPEQPLLDGGAAFTAEEERLAAQIRDAGEAADNLDAVGAAIGGSYILYRLYMARRLREETLNRVLTPATLWDLNTRLFEGILPRFIATAAPALISGYVMGLREAGHPTAPWVNSVAAKYAESLGEHINEVSGQALVEGFQAQLNRRVAARVAMDRTINAFGVAPRTMRSLVNIWVGPPTTTTTTNPTTNKVGARADKVIAEAIKRRATDIASTEAYASKNQAKALVWLFMAQEGDLARDAEKEWLTARDERVCAVCGPMHKIRVPVSEQFVLPGGVKVWAPGVHPRCRCNVVLRFAADRIITLDLSTEGVPEAVAKSVWGVVHKARGSDSFDRDNRGRFAAQESRSVRRPTRPAVEVDRTNPEVQMLMAEARRMSQEAGVASASEVFARHGVVQPPKLEAAPKIGGPKIEAPPKIGGPKLTEDARVGGPRLGKPKLSGPKLGRPSLANAKLPDNSAVLRGLNPTVGFVAPDLGEPVAPAGAVSENWTNTPDGKPMFGIFDRVINNTENGLLWSDESVDWYTAGTSGRGIPTLEQGVYNYWQDKVLNDESMDQLFIADGRDYGDIEGPNDEALIIMYSEDGDLEYYVDRASYEAAWKSSLYGLDRNEAPSVMVRGVHIVMPYNPNHSYYEELQDILREEGEDAYDNAVQDIEPEFVEEGEYMVSALELAENLDIPSRIQQMRPIVGASNYYKADDSDGYWGGVMSHNGKWRVVSNDLGITASDTWKGRDAIMPLPYELRRVEPEDLYD